MVSAPLSSRFGISLRFDYYGAEELELVIRRSAAILNIKIGTEAISHLAATSRGTPRIANRLLRRMRDFAQVAGKAEIDGVVREGRA